jgi:C1A family cysteine protease
MPRRRNLGWLPQLPDVRDLAYTAPMGVLLPPAVDLRPRMPPVYDQGQIGSCTANATDAIVQFLLRPPGDTPWFSGSRLFIYYNTRATEGTIGSDAGGSIRDAIKSVAAFGVPAETAWPYSGEPAREDGTFAPGQAATLQPPPAIYDAAATAKAVRYHAVAQDLQHLKTCLAEGFPIAFGFTIYSSFFDPSDAPLRTIPLPGPNDGVEGGHAVVIIGYDDGDAFFTIRNSWGPGVQDHGHFYLPYAYVTNPNLASDFWTIRAVQPQGPTS